MGLHCDDQNCGCHYERPITPAPQIRAFVLLTQNDRGLQTLEFATLRESLTHDGWFVSLRTIAENFTTLSEAEAFLQKEGFIEISIPVLAGLYGRIL